MSADSAEGLLLDLAADPSLVRRDTVTDIHDEDCSQKKSNVEENDSNMSDCMLEELLLLFNTPSAWSESDDRQAPQNIGDDDSIYAPAAYQQLGTSLPILSKVLERNHQAPCAARRVAARSYGDVLVCKSEWHDLTLLRGDSTCAQSSNPLLHKSAPRRLVQVELA